MRILMMFKKISFLSLCFLCIIFLTGCMSKVDINTLNEKAAGYMQNGEYDKAIERLNSINDLDPRYPSTYYNLGIAYYKKGEYIKSLENLQKAISIDKNLKDAYYSSAVVYEEIGAAIQSSEGGEDDNAEKNEKTEELRCYENFLSENKPAAAALEGDKKSETAVCYGYAISNYEKYISLSKDEKENSKIKDQIAFLREEIKKVNSDDSEDEGED